MKPGRIHVWSVSLDGPKQRMDENASLLSPDEAERARRFSHPEHRGRWVLGRATLRAILARYTKEAPEEIRFRYDKGGKPRLASPASTPEVHFNLSHSGALMVLGVTHVGPIGVDVEQLQELPDRDGLMARFFSAAEQRAIRELPRSHRTEAFYSCWTRKEAYLKALGLGLSGSLDAFDVSVAPESARVLAVRGHVEKARGWSMFDLQARSGYAGALAIKTETACKVVSRRFEDS